MGNNPFPPQFFCTDAGDMTTDKTPAIKKPSKRYGDISFVKPHNSNMKISIKLITHYYFNNKDYILNIDHSIHI